MNKFVVITAILTLFSTPAFSQASSPSGGGGLLGLAPLIIIGITYYCFWRYQNKKKKMYEQRLEQRFVDIENRLENMENSQRRDLNQ